MKGGVEPRNDQPPDHGATTMGGGGGVLGVQTLPFGSVKMGFGVVAPCPD